MSAPPIPPLSFTGGPSGPALAEGVLADYGSAYQGGWTYSAPFTVGGSGFGASASGAASLWKWLALAGAAVLIARMLRG